MRELRDEEVTALQDLAQRPPNSLLTGSALVPVLPIILTEQNLSTTHYGRHHPRHWSPADGILGLARESCRHNLGMTTLEPLHDEQGFYFRPHWLPPASANTSDPP
jgi:hypothetical protein